MSVLGIDLGLSMVKQSKSFLIILEIIIVRSGTRHTSLNVNCRFCELRLADGAILANLKPLEPDQIVLLPSKVGY